MRKRTYQYGDQSLQATFAGIIRDKDWEKKFDQHRVFLKWTELVDQQTANSPEVPVALREAKQLGARRFDRNRIIAACPPRVAPCNAEQPQPEPRPRTMARDGLHGIAGTGRQMPAGPPEQGRKGQLIGADEHQEKALHVRSVMRDSREGKKHLPPGKASYIKRGLSSPEIQSGQKD